MPSMGAQTAFSCFMMETLKSSWPFLTMSPGATCTIQRSAFLGLATSPGTEGSASVTPAFFADPVSSFTSVVRISLSST